MAFAPAFKLFPCKVILYFYFMGSGLVLAFQPSAIPFFWPG
jgi:hypothetical protein